MPKNFSVRHSGHYGPWGVFCLVVSHLGLLLTFRLADRLGWMLLFLGIGFLGLWLATRRQAFARALSSLAILSLAACLRLFLLPLPPTLSDDVVRYVWDGRVAAAGFNPYRLAPDADELIPLRGELWEQVPHRNVPTVYPPLALATFSIVAQAPRPVLFLKLVLALADLATCLVLIRLAQKMDLSAGRVLWYAWNPLVVLEVAGMGHVDALGVAALVAAVWFLARQPPQVAQAATAAAAAVLAKLVPLLVLPAWGRQSRRPATYWLVTAGILGVSLGAVFVYTGGVPPGLVTYAASWEFNGPLYEPLWRGLDFVGVQGKVVLLLDRLKDLTGSHDLWNLLYPYNYARLQARLLLSLGIVVGILAAFRTKHPLDSVGVGLGTALLCSATVYPWYLLWVLPWAALRNQRAWLLLSATILISYLSQFGGVPLFPGLYAAIWLPFGVLVLQDRR